MLREEKRLLGNKFSKVLCVVTVYGKITRALTFAKRASSAFSKIRSLVPLYGKYTRPLTSENFFWGVRGAMC